jgi:glycine cleavage system H lipoate-binding protein/ABC-type phosphate transport system substrate-binding protein
MKTAKKMTIGMTMLIFTMAAIQGAAEEKVTDGNVDLQLVCCPALQSLANQLAANYTREHGGAQIEVTTVYDQQISGTIHEGTVALVTKEFLAGLEGESYFKLVLGRDAIVPVMNDNHPQIELIREHGISALQFTQIYREEDHFTWGEVLGISDGHPVHAYMPGNSFEINYLAEFLQIAPGQIKGLMVTETEEMLKRIENDRGAIGFCNLATLMALENQGVAAGIAVVPVDMDGDGRINAFEDVYSSTSMLSHAIYVGRFPRTLYSRIFAVTSQQPVTTEQLALMEWMINEGQEVMASTGLLKLGYGEKASVTEKLASHVQAVASEPVHASPSMVILLVAGILLLCGFLVFLFAWISARRVEVHTVVYSEGGESAAFPGGLFFDRTHTWAFMEKSGRVRIGIDYFLQNVTGPLTRVVMRQPGDQIKRGDPFLALIQNGKRLDIKSPVSGIVEKQNQELLNDATLLNSDPYAEGWVLLVKPVNWISELKSFFMGDPYANWLKAEAARLKEFLTSVLGTQGNLKAVPVLQDGGEIKGGVLEAFGPEVWEEFQVGFINSTK